MIRSVNLLMLAALLPALASCGVSGRMLRGYAEADPEGMELLAEGSPYALAGRHLEGQVRFVFDDFGSLSTDGLETYGVPWKLAAAALVMDRHERDGEPLAWTTLDHALRTYGFVRPTAIANWEGPQPRMERPLGVIAGMARRGFPSVEIEIANIGCAACHSGPLYGENGLPTGESWLGLPNASIDLSRYASDLFRSLREALERPDALMEAVVAVFPDVSDRELSTLRRHVIPGARADLADREERYGGILPFENGGPGLSNGVGSLRFLAGLTHADARGEDVAWTGAPDLTGTTLRRSILVDGVYSPPGWERFRPTSADDVSDAHLAGLAGIVSLFVVGTQGVDPERARASIPRVTDVMHFLWELEPPPFPGPVDHRLAEDGAQLYVDACAACHGTYSPGTRDVRLLTHPNRLVAQDRMLTDPTRWQAADPSSLALVTGALGFAREIEPMNTGGYVAPDLSGIWATAPYLHNGSVPTLWHLLRPEERPARFQVGGHAMDYERMGIAGRLDEEGTYRYADGYAPWTGSVIYDTSEPGRSNAGHEFRNLTEAGRRALLEYLKVL